MLTIAVPMAGSSAFFPPSEHRFPKVFHEIHGRPMIEVVLEKLMTIRSPKRFVFVVNDQDVKKFRLDNVLRMLSDGNCEIVLQKAQTKGAVCSLLLGVAHLNNDGPLVICNADQVIGHDLNRIVDFFDPRERDGGVVCFDSVHPQWSYARVVGESTLAETAEKEPISRNAIAGMYFFGRGRDFVEAAMRSIVKDRSHDGLYFTSAVLNEMILDNKKLGVYRIPSDEYHSFYSPERIRDYEQRIQGGGS
jgi:CTP:molybdopterin cytidylyltransferase MocA